MIASLRTALLAGAALLPCAAKAADVTPEQGRAAEAAVRSWINGMLGPAVTLGASPVALTPAGDHFDMTMPVATLPGQPPAAGAVMAQARPLDGGKWAVDDIHASMPLKFTVMVPVPADEKKEGEKKPEEKRAGRPGDKAAPGKPPAATATPASIPVRYTIDIVGQDGHAVIDPSLATASTWTTTAKSGTIRTEGGPMPLDSTIGAYTSNAVVQPAGPNQVDVKVDAVLQDYHIATLAGAPVAFTFDMKAVKFAMALLGVDRVKGQAVSRAATSIIVAGGVPGPGPAKVGPELVTAMLDALKDAATEASLEEEVDGLSINASGVPVTIGKAAFMIDGKSVDGMLEARMPVEVRDIGVEGVLPPDMAALLPTLVALRPVVSGVGVAELSRIAAAYNDKKEPSPADVQAVFSHGGVKLGLESMSLAFGGALFEGQGSVTYTSVTDRNGTMRITATGYDDMMQKVAAIPAFSGQAVPALAFVKGIGKTENNKIVWDIVYKDGKALVNNVDMSSLMGGADKGPATTPTRPPGGRVVPK